MLKDLLVKYRTWEKRANRKLDKFFEPIDLTKKFPGYFHKWVFRFFILLIIFIAAFDFYTNGVYSYSIGCNESIPCKNPYYLCQPGEITDCEQIIPSNVCQDVPCDKKYIEPGEYYGRTDFLYKYGWLFIFILVLITFITNHIVYAIKNRSWIYRRRK